MNIVVPCAGRGLRFVQAGFLHPKPLIDVRGTPMLKLVYDNIGAVNATHITILQKDHWDRYKTAWFDIAPPNTTHVLTDGITEGAACTILLAEYFIDSDEPLFMANSDQYVEGWDMTDFLLTMDAKNADGGIVTFKASHPKWSFAKISPAGVVTEVAEKNPISDNATVGFYYWRKGSDFVKYAKRMISKNIRVNNEFYTCPVYNQAIEDGKRIIAYEVSGMHGLGTPEDLTTYITTR